MKNIITLLLILLSFTSFSQQFIDLNWERVHQIEPYEKIQAIIQSNDTLYGIGKNFTQISIDNGATWKKECNAEEGSINILTINQNEVLYRKTISGEGTSNSPAYYESFVQNGCAINSFSSENYFSAKGFFGEPITEGVTTFRHTILPNDQFMYYRNRFHSASPNDNGSFYNYTYFSFIINDKKTNLKTSYFDFSTGKRVIEEHRDFDVLSNISNIIDSELISTVFDTLYLIDSTNLEVLHKKILPIEKFELAKLSVLDGIIYLPSSYSLHFYKSDDKGDSWERIDQNLDIDGDFRSHEIKNGFHIVHTTKYDYIGTNLDSLTKSSIKFDKFADFFPFDNLIIATKKYSNIFFRSFDNGVNWDTIYTTNKIRYFDSKIYTIRNNKLFFLDENNQEQNEDNHQYLNAPGEIFHLGELVVRKNEFGYFKLENKQWIPLKNGDIEFKNLTKNIRSNQLVAYGQKMLHTSEDNGATWTSTPLNFPHVLVADILAINDTIILTTYDKLFSKIGNGDWQKHGRIGEYADAEYFNNAIYVVGNSISKYDDITKQPIVLGGFSSNFVSRHRIFKFDEFMAMGKYNEFYIIDKQDEVFSIKQNLNVVTNLFLDDKELYTIQDDLSIWKTTLQICDAGFIGASCDDNNPNTYYDQIQENCECKGEVIEDDCSIKDRAILHTFYKNLNGPNWRGRSAWLSDESLGNWFGIKTDSNGCVTSIDLKFSNLQGELPEEIGQLKQLQNLTLHNNHITGNIPSSLSDLQHLEKCYLSYNNLSGCFPELPNICQLPYNSNYTKGHDGDEIAHYEGKGYNFSHNDLLPLQGDFQKICDGEAQIGASCEAGDHFENAYIQEDCTCVGLPVSESPCRKNDSTALHRIYSFGGGNSKWENWNSDASLRKWDGITTDDDGCVTEIFTYNFHKLPSAIGNLTHLRKIELGGSTGLIGTIPKTIGNLENLESLIISGKMTGAIPREIGNLSNLKELVLHNNEFTKMPKEIGNLHSLEKLNISSNKLKGKIPKEIGQLDSLKSLVLSHNELSGEIPIEISNLSNLEGFSLSSNQLTGIIPKEIGNLSQLKYIGLGWNQLSGPIPHEIEKLTHLKSINLALNFLNDSFPIELVHLPELVNINLSSTHISGMFPNEITNLSHLKYLNLRDNSLTGELPENIGDLPNLTHVDLRNNKLSGNLPQELAKLSDLEILFLEKNNFSGCIDQAILDSFCGNKEIRFDLFGNDLLPYRGYFSKICDGNPQIGAPCNDHDSTTTNDIINENCQCAGMTVGNHDIQNLENIQIVPNPNDGRFTLIIHAKKHEKMNMSIISLMGQTIISKEIDGKQIEEKVDISYIPKGIYYLQISTEKDISTQKIIVE